MIGIISYGSSFAHPCEEVELPATCCVTKQLGVTVMMADVIDRVIDIGYLYVECGL